MLAGQPGNLFAASHSLLDICPLASKTSLDRLRRAAEILERASNPEARTVAAGLRRFADGQADSLEEALDLKRGPGERSLKTDLLQADRDNLIRAAAKRYCAAMSVNSASEMLATKFLRYEGTAWVREKNAPTCPVRHSGRVEEAAWRILKTGLRIPGKSRIRQILSDRESSGEI